MITASATDTILASPVISVILGGLGTGVVAILVGVFRVLARLTLIEAQITRLGDKLTEVEKDLDVIKWGAVAGAQFIRPQPPIQTGELP